MALIEFNPEQVPHIKLGLHVAQMVFVFVLWCLEIAVFTGSVMNGNNGWVFGLCFLTIPAWIYLCMAPRFPRARKFAEPRVMAVIDGIFAIFWLSAFSSQAAFNSAGSCFREATDDEEENDVCTISKTIVGLAFFVMVFFICSTLVSIYTVQYYQWNNGRLPGYDRTQLGGGANGSTTNIDPHKADFSTDIHDDEAQAQYATLNMNDRDDDINTSYGGAGGTGGYSSINSRYGNNTSDIDGSGLGTAGRSDLSGYTQDTTEYRPGATSSVGGHAYNPPSAESAYEDERPAQFPTGPYGR